MDSDIISQLKSHFTTFYNQAIDNAIVRFSAVLGNIENLSVEDKIIEIKEEIDRLKIEENALEKSEYKELSFDEVWLFQCFTNRFLIYNVDDSENAFNGISLGHYEQKLQSLFRDLSKELPKYTFDDFLHGKEDKLFINLYKKSPNLPDEEFLKIHTWQNKHYSALKEFQRLKMVSNFRRSTDITNYLKEIKTEIELFDYIFNFEGFTPDLLIQSFKKLTALQGYNFASIDKPEFVSLFLNYKKGLVDFSSLNPKTLLPLLDNYKRNPDSKLVCYPSLIFASLDLYRIWLKMIVNGTSNYQDDCITSYDNLLLECKLSGIKKADNFISSFNKKYAILNPKSTEYKSVLNEQSNLLRNSLNSLSHRQYYNFMDNPEVLYSMFSSFYTLNESPLVEAETLSHSFELDKKISFVTDKLFKAFGNHKFSDDGDETFTSLVDWKYMMKATTLDSDLLKKFRNLVSEFMNNKLSGRMPINYLFKNFDEGISEILNEALTRLQSAIQNSSTNTKTVYIHNRLKNLRNRELNARRNGSSTGNFHSYFKEFLEIEADYLKETIHLNFKQMNIPLFIDEQSENKSNASTSQKSNKLKTKLSVPQLTYFFKALVAEGFFESKTQKEIYDFISANFTSKASEIISVNSIKNNYEQPKLEDVDFIHKKFINLSQKAYKDKENL